MLDRADIDSDVAPQEMFGLRNRTRLPRISLTKMCRLRSGDNPQKDVQQQRNRQKV